MPLRRLIAALRQPPKAGVGLGRLIAAVSGGLVLVALVLYGVVFYPLMEATNTTEFCISCHSMQATVYQEYKKSVHYSNRAGVRAGCPDCHVPKQLGPKLVAKVRAAKDETEIVHLIANELRKLVAGRQTIVLRANRAGVLKVIGVSSLVLADKETPFVRWVEGLVQQIQKENGTAEAVAFELPAFTDSTSTETRNYPFAHMVWQPMSLTSGETFAGVLVTRERPWSDQDRKIIARQAGVFANAWQALYGAKPLRTRHWFGRRMRIALASVAIVGALLPVPMTTLAPVEIVARNPQRVTAPIDGVIKEILVEPNRPVEPGRADAG